MLVRGVASFTFSKPQPCTFTPAGFLHTQAHAQSSVLKVLHAAGRASASPRFLVTFKGEEYILQSEKESCHVLEL